MRGLLVLILLLGAFLRFYRIDENFIFIGEVGHNLLAIKQAYITGQLPLIGPPTSHPWLSFGPFFYWLYGPVLILSNFNPLSHAYFGALLSFLIILLNYFVIKNMFNEKMALISSYLIAVSPLFLQFTRSARFFFIVTLLIYPFIHFLHKAVRGETKYFFWFAFVFGAMFSFHFTPLMLFPIAVLFIYLSRRKMSKYDVLNILAGLFLSILPFLLYDLLHGLQMVRNVLLWIPYRVAGFFGLYPKNTVNTTVVQDNISSLYRFVVESFVPLSNNYLGITLVIVFLVLLSISIYSVWKSKNYTSSLSFLLIWFGLSYLAVFIHGSPPIHYFVPLLPLPILLISYWLTAIWQERYAKVVVISFLISLSMVNLSYYFSSKWFFVPSEKVTKEPYYNPYSLQRETVRKIIIDAKGEPFILRRVGQDDQFEGDYAQNYSYLLWLSGNEPVNEAKLVYTIYENTDVYKPEKANNAFRVGNITVVRE